ncbi:MAG: hypothetical protein OHK0013_17540 [Sandaracinaceae bacterium]
MGLLSAWSPRQIAQAIKAGAPLGGTADGLDEPDPPDDRDGDVHSRMRWCDICRRAEYRGRWVALDQCRYDEQGRAAEGAVVDADDDLVELCSRMREADRKNCAILFASED